MKTQRKVFEMPKHPRTGVVNKIIIEKPSNDSVWYLVVDKNKAKPLIGLKNPKNPKQVLGALEKTCGSDDIAQYMMEGYSKE
jgi:hypothetical protein